MVRGKAGPPEDASAPSGSPREKAFPILLNRYVRYERPDRAESARSHGVIAERAEWPAGSTGNPEI